MRILVATGGAAHSERAVRFCTQLFRMIKNSPEFTILTVVKYETDRLRAEEILNKACQILDAPGAMITTTTRVGHPAEEIIREAEEGGYRLVVVGEKQHHGFVTRFILGSTALRVVEHAPCPVIVAKGKIGPIRRILLCDSGLRDPSLPDRFIEQVGDLMQGKEELTILHVMSQMSAGPGVTGKQLTAEANELIFEHAPEGELLKQDLQQLARLTVYPHPKVRHGLVVDEILAEACEGDYDLVVIGAHRGEGWRRILLDDLAHQIVTHIDRPVLIVR